MGVKCYSTLRLCRVGESAMLWNGQGKEKPLRRGAYLGPAGNLLLWQITEKRSVAIAADWSEWPSVLLDHDSSAFQWLLTFLAFHIGFASLVMIYLSILGFHFRSSWC